MYDLRICPYFDKDPIFSKLLYEAHKADVKIKVLRCSVA